MRYCITTLLVFAFIAVNAQKRKPIDVYLIGGQSNATGQGYMANRADTMVIDTRVMIFHSGAPHLNSGLPPYTWQPLHQASESPDRFGPELGFGSKLHRLQPNAKIAIIKHAHSGTNLYEQWNPGQNDKDTANWGVQFIVFVKTVNAGMDSLRLRGYEPVIKGMLWQQGESDADKGGDASREYGQHLKKFVERVRKQFRQKNMLFVYGYVYPPPNAGNNITEVRQAEHGLDHNSGSDLSVKRAFVVETDGLSQRADDPNTKYPKDRIHFGTKGTWELGVRMALKMHEQLK